MKKSLITMALAAALLAQAQAAPAPQQTAPGAASAQQKKVIQDPAEYNAYIAAINATDASQKAQMLESYLQTYPKSVMQEDGLELLLKTYQQLNKPDQIKAVSQRLLQVNAQNLTALALLSYLDRAQAQQGGADAATTLQEAGQLGARGLTVLQTAVKPEGYTDEQWTSMKSSFRIVFLGSVGHAALAAKDYPAAQQNLKEVVAAQPTDVNSIYLLSLAYLSPKPVVVDGLFWVARAAALTQNPELLKYAKNQYIRYHGSDEKFADLLAQAKVATTLPADFSVKPAPSPAEQARVQAHDMLKKGTPESLSFAEWQFILTYGSHEDVTAVWAAIKGKPVQMVAVLIDGSRESLKLAGSVDDIDAKKADIIFTLKEALAAGHTLKAGARLTVQGTPTEYAVQGDTFTMTFVDGEVLKGLAPTTPAVRHKK